MKLRGQLVKWSTSVEDKQSETDTLNNQSVANNKQHTSLKLS